MSTVKSVIVKNRECGCSKTFSPHNSYGKNVLLKLCAIHQHDFDTIDTELETILDDVHTIKAKHALLLADIIQNK